VDLLNDHLVRARATGAVFARTAVEPPWGLKLGGSIQLAVHAVTRGKAWLWFDDPTDAVELVPGEITLVRGAGGITSSRTSQVPTVGSRMTFDTSTQRDHPSQTMPRRSSSVAPISSRATLVPDYSIPYHPC
jgi:hypothetical protein